MMRIFYCSDIHLEFGAVDLATIPSGDVMILAGDITLARCLDPKKTDADCRKLRKRTHEFIDAICERFGRVYYIIGNHEAYGFNLSETPDAIRHYLPGVTLLDDLVVELDDQTLLVGGTLWTDMNKGKDCWIVGRGMNDFRHVRVNSQEPRAWRGEVTFSPEAAMKLFAKTKALISRTAKKNPDKTIVVATHHAPSLQGLNPEHSGGEFGSINHGYYTDLESFIAKHPNIKHWIFGHTHIQTSFRVSQCECVSNARGYIGRETSADTFTMDRSFDVRETVDA